jgi:hypothetical protein
VFSIPILPSDDVDDRYTEQGRGLLTKEREAAANGLRIGDVLHSAAIDAEFPGLGPVKSELFHRAAAARRRHGAAWGMFGAVVARRLCWLRQRLAGSCWVAGSRGAASRDAGALLLGITGRACGCCSLHGSRGHPAGGEISVMVHANWQIE